MARTRSHTRRHSRSNPRGVLSARGDGFGFVKTSEGEFFIPSAKMAGAFDGDLVEVAPLPTPHHKGKQSNQKIQALRPHEQPAARVVRVIDRAHDTLIGRYEVAEPFGVVVPEDTRIPYDIFTMRADHSEIADGALVRVRVTAFPTRHTAATGVVEEVLGQAGDDSLGVELIVARHKLETAFSEAALEQARAAALNEEEALSQGYRDLRDRFTFTIDPDDARDFDDAVSLERVEQSHRVGAKVRVVDGRGFSASVWRLGVHIADVSHYVPWGSSLDLDARRRATSVYLVDRVIPMLPEELSGDLCSLRPGEVRRSMTVDLYVDNQARLVAFEAYPALICSDARLTYKEAQDILDAARGGADVGALSLDMNVAAGGAITDSSTKASALEWRMATLSRLAKLRYAARLEAGGLDFDTTEARVCLNEEGHPLGIEVRKKTDATALIEEAMIWTNEVVAQYLRDTHTPGIFRVHEKPAADSLAALVPVFQEFLWFKDIDQNRFIAGDPHVLEKALQASKGRSEGELVSTLVLRSMKRAVYKPLCELHYGLASEAYAHFTSPIRRYPDLIVHRMLKAQLTKRPEKFDQEVAALPWISEHSSAMERVAEKAARESQELKLVEYMERFVGQAFSAVVSGVTTYGLYVRLENTAEGLVPLKNLGCEYFAYDPVLHRLTGQDSGDKYRLGQRLAVVLTPADERSGRLDFRLEKQV